MKRFGPFISFIIFLSACSSGLGGGGGGAPSNSNQQVNISNDQVNLPEVASVTFPSGTFQSENQIKLSTSTSAQLADVFLNNTDLFETNGKLGYDLHINIGNNVLQNKQLSIVINIPESFLANLPPGYQIQAFAYNYYENDDPLEGEVEESFELYRGIYDSNAQTLTVNLPSTVFSNITTPDHSFEAIITLGYIPGKQAQPGSLKGSKFSSNLSTQPNPVTVFCSTPGMNLTVKNNPLLNNQIQINGLFGEVRLVYANGIPNGQTHTHEGIDLKADSPTPVYSIAPGYIIMYGYDSESGQKVVVKHCDGTSSVYYHLSLGSILGNGQPLPNQYGFNSVTNQYSNTRHDIDNSQVVQYPVLPGLNQLATSGATGVAAKTGPHLHLGYNPDGGTAGSADPTPSLIQSLQISPSTNSVLLTGVTQAYQVSAYDNSNLPISVRRDYNSQTYLNITANNMIPVPYPLPPLTSSHNPIINIAWSSSNSSAASVSTVSDYVDTTVTAIQTDNGINQVTGVCPGGTATISAQSNSPAGTVIGSPATYASTVTQSSQGCISVSPATVSLVPTFTQQFTATSSLTGSTAAVSWSATGGTIDSNGYYTAPNAPGTFTVTATSQTPNQSASATVTVLNGITYTYTGNPFTESKQCPESGCITQEIPPEGGITASLTFSQPLPPNCGKEQPALVGCVLPSILELSMSDGLFDQITITNPSPTTLANYLPALTIITDATGKIVYWLVSYSCELNINQYALCPSTLAGYTTFGFYTTTVEDGISSSISNNLPNNLLNIQNPGIWKSQAIK
jgi:murein DD-endopeptidase MepM/ murein hydrolase activator NlpD